jgi:hypothetical protein
VWEQWIVLMTSSLCYLFQRQWVCPRLFAFHVVCQATAGSCSFQVYCWEGRCSPRVPVGRVNWARQAVSKAEAHCACCCIKNLGLGVLQCLSPRLRGNHCPCRVGWVDPATRTLVVSCMLPCYLSETNCLCPSCFLLRSIE